VTDIADLDAVQLATEPVGGRRRTTSSVCWLVAPLTVVVALALAAPLLPLPNPGQQDLAARFQPPVWDSGDWTHVLGTDHLGRDVLSRLLHGARLTFAIAVSGVLVAGGVGALLGIVAGYRRGWADRVVTRLIDAQLALPFMLLAMAIIASSGRSLAVLVLVLATYGWAQYARVLRAETLSLRSRPFVLGLRSAGASPTRIMVAHILPNVTNSFLVIATFEVGTMILGEGALSFLGLGVASPQVSWGLMLAEGRDHLARAWWVVAFPGMAIAAVVLLTNLLGDALRVVYDPRHRGQGAS
jgi:peptide/nickel transport system permease protein